MRRIKDIPPIKGMNSVDDPKRLQDGECVRLLNAFPGNPPAIRNGCPGSYRSFIDNTSKFIPPSVVYGNREDDKKYIVGWIYSGTFDRYYLTYQEADYNGSDTITSLGYATADNPLFSFKKNHGFIYCFIEDELTSWNGAATATGSKVIESLGVVRDMFITQFATAYDVREVSGGNLLKDNWYQYAFQFVRRNDADAFEAGTTPTGMILPPGITGKPAYIETFMPGVIIGPESVDSRWTTLILNTTAYNVIEIANTSEKNIAIAEGATHIRVSRTKGQDTEVIAQGTTKYWLFDIPIGDTVDDEFNDNKSDDYIDGNEAYPLVTGYTNPPYSPFGYFHKDRMWVMNRAGIVYYSEAPGGSGMDLEVTQLQPEAFATLFKPFSYFIDCDSDDAVNASGIETIENDIFFFKDSKIFVLYGGDPTATAVTVLSNSIGCPFPHTINKCEIKGNGECIFFLSNRGPMMIESGGRVSPFAPYKIKELWKQVDGVKSELFLALEASGSSIEKYIELITHTFCFYYNYTIWMMYSIEEFSIRKIFGYYMNPIDDEERGAMEMELAVTEIRNYSIAQDDETLKTYLLGNTETRLAVMEFLQQDFWEDIATEAVHYGGEPILDSSDMIVEQSLLVLE